GAEADRDQAAAREGAPHHDSERGPVLAPRGRRTRPRAVRPGTARLKASDGPLVAQRDPERDPVTAGSERSRSGARGEGPDGGEIRGLPERNAGAGIVRDEDAQAVERGDNGTVQAVPGESQKQNAGRSADHGDRVRGVVGDPD